VTQFAYVAPERDQVDLKLDALLIAWYEYRRGYRFGRGHKAAAVTSSYQTPGHWDWKNGASDDRANELVDKQVDQAIQRIPNVPERWRTALEFEAMNLSSGAAVWTSPMLPRDKNAREVLVLEARNRLLVELRRDGVMT
jgi:hypothetical protein